MIQPARLKKLLQRLVNIYSPSGKEEDILEYLRGYLKRRNLSVSAQPVDENRYNLIVAPPSTDLRLALIGHVDTVSAYDLENYGYAEQDDVVSGLGTADMKGGCAAMVEAWLSLHESGSSALPGALCLVVGEEESGDGAEKLMKDYHFPWAVIGEPTGLVPCLKSFGYLECQITAMGKRRHASLASPQDSAIEVLLNKVLQITHYMSHSRAELVYNIRDLFSTRAGFAVPERCEAWLDIHTPPQAPLGTIITELEEVVTQGPGADSGIEVVFRPVTIDAGYELPEKGQAVEALQQTYARHGLLWATDAFRSHSDANQIWAAGTKPILLGPGQLEQAHSEDEAVSFEQVCLAAQIYLDFMREFFATTA
ncbi:MAG: M20/M25/M40 family metallo-hydrolase [Desulfobacterales bacterium]|nr:MAG: M20/M25/M40 family metallo-hydrolase [Desulfobacterales bacterium]